MANLVGGIIGRFSKQGNTQAPVPHRLTGLQSLAVAQIEPMNAEAARAGVRFGGGTQIIANGIAPVAAIPTTTATLYLYNGDPTRSYLVDQLDFYLGSGTAAAGATLLATVAKLTSAAPTANATGYGSQSMSGSSRTSKAFWSTAGTLAAGTNWVPMISTLQLAAANVGQGDQVQQTWGSILVPPGYVLGIAILSGAGTTPLYAIGAIWDELELDLE